MADPFAVPSQLSSSQKRGFPARNGLRLVRLRSGEMEKDAPYSCYATAVVTHRQVTRVLFTLVCACGVDKGVVESWAARQKRVRDQYSIVVKEAWSSTTMYRVHLLFYPRWRTNGRFSLP